MNSQTFSEAIICAWAAEAANLVHVFDPKYYTGFILTPSCRTELQFFATHFPHETYPSYLQAGFLKNQSIIVQVHF
jgi:hypothetical protein